MIILARKTVHIILSVLIITNAIWVAVSGLSGPFIALGFYIIILFLCYYKQHYKAGIISGIMGFLVHILELVFYDLKELGGMEILFFILNLILPVAIIFFSYKADKELR